MPSLVQNLIIICIYTFVVSILGGIALKYSIQDKKNGLRWKSHIQKLYFWLTVLIVLEILFDVICIATGYNIKEHEYVDSLVNMIDTLPVNYTGMMLVCISCHCYATRKRIMCHFLPFILIILGDIILPDIGWAWILFSMYVFYCVYVITLYIRGDKYMKKTANDLYVDSFERLPHIKLLLIVSICCAGVIWSMSLFNTFITDAIAEISFIPIWIFFLHTIHTLRESRLIEPMELKTLSLVAVEKTVEEPSKELTEAITYVGENIEKALLDGDFYLRSDLNAQLLAEKMGTNRTYISKYLNSTGTNFSTVVNNLRMKHAWKLIMTTNDSIPDICTVCGYLSIVTFRKFFMQTYGTTPEMFAKKKRAARK